MGEGTYDVDRPLEPNCRIASWAIRKPFWRKDEPYKHMQDDKLIEDSVIMVRVAKSAIIQHSVGEFFGIEHIYTCLLYTSDAADE